MKGSVKTMKICTRCLKSGKVTKVGTDIFAHPNREMQPVWSPDSKWIAYARQLNSSFKAIFVYNIETKETLQFTDYENKYDLLDKKNNIYQKSSIMGC